MSWRRIWSVLAGAAVVLGATAAPAAAHNVLLSTNPADGATVARAPAAVVLTFDQPAIAIGTQLLIRGPAGEVQQGNPRLVDTTVNQALQPGAPAGTYTVSWRVTSADGHPVSGQFTFHARAAGAAGPAITSTPTASPAVPTRTGGFPWWATVLVGVAFLALAVVVTRRARLRG